MEIPSPLAWLACSKGSIIKACNAQNKVSDCGHKVRTIQGKNRLWIFTALAVELTKGQIQLPFASSEHLAEVMENRGALVYSKLSS